MDNDNMYIEEDKVYKIRFINYKESLSARSFLILKSFLKALD
jgi:hypothetical protein